MHRSAKWVAPLAFVLLGGCGTEPVPRYTPAMPQVGAATPRATVNVRDVLAQAREHVGRNEFAEAVNTMSAIPEAERGATFVEFAREIARDDPVRATQLALAMPVGVAPEDALTAATHAWMARDRDAAVTWALDLQPARLRFVAMQAVAADLVADHPRAAVDWIQALPDRPRRSELLRLAAARWAQRDPDAALGWANTLSGEMKDRVAASIAFELAQTDPVRAASLAGTLPGNRDRWLLLAMVAETWMARDPRATLAWTRALPRGPEQDAALAGIASATGPIARRSNASQGGFRGGARLPGGGSSSVAVLGAVASLPLGLERSEAVRRDFERRLQESPARAADWLATLPAPDVSDEMVLRLAREWFRQDPVAASTWVQTNVASPTRREMIFQEIRP